MGSRSAANPSYAIRLLRNSAPTQFGIVSAADFYHEDTKTRSWEIGLWASVSGHLEGGSDPL
jgi:hypothetical protein